MKYLSLFLLISITSNMSGQRLDPKPRVAFLSRDTVDVVVIDSRSKSDDDYLKLPDALSDALSRAYPDAAVRRLPDSSFYRTAITGHITLKVQLLAYQRGFGIEAGAGISSAPGVAIPVVVPTGKWNGVTVLGLTIFDKRGSRDGKYASTIERVVSKSNMWGGRSGTQAMQESFVEALNALLVFVDTTFLG